MTELRTGTPEEAGMDPHRIELIRQRGAQWAQQDNTLGLVLVVARYGVVCLHEAWGQTRPGADAPPVTTDSIFWYASITKSMVAVACMILVQEGRLGLTRPVSHYIPELTAPGTENLHVHHLLSHTSGYDGTQTPIDVAAKLEAGIDLPERPDQQHPYMHRMLHALYALQPHQPPGAIMSYAHENYALLGEIIWRVSGSHWTDFMQQRLFGPLGMTRSRAGFVPEMEQELVWDFANEVMPGMTGDAFRALLDLPHPAGRTFGTAFDCAIYAQMLLNGGHYGSTRVLYPACIKQMTRNQIPGVAANLLGNKFTDASWGWGFDVLSTNRWRWFDGDLPANGSFAHNGAGGTAFWVDPTRDLVGVYFSHCLDIDLDRSEGHWDLDLFENLVSAAVVE